MKLLLKTFIISTLLGSYPVSSYAYVSQLNQGILIGYTINKIMTSSNKTETNNCNEDPVLCTTNPKEKIAKNKFKNRLTFG